MEKTHMALVPELQLMGDDAHQLGRSQELHGRVVRDMVDLELLRRWIGLCERTHGAECAEPWWAPTEKWDLPSAARLLDVSDMALVPARRNIRYIALSYVWGNVAEGANTAYWTTKENLTQRKAPGGVSLDILPTTITDAILLTRLLGERHLWIDALCIAQNDPADKAVNIGAMDAVYRRAVLTVFSAGGSSAHAPLPGLRPGTRVSSQHIAEVQGLRFAVPLPASREALARTTWNSRGWTYQELMLSPRRLLFTPSQVIFECNKCVWGEDLVAELPDGECPTHRLETGVVGRLMFAQKPAQWLRNTDIWVGDYLHSVESYAARRLTNEGDAVDAFSALTSAVAKAYGLAGGDPGRAFRYGMAVTELETAMLWQPVVGVRAERREVVGRDGEVRAMFPSWAFTGWRSPVRYEGEDQFVVFGSGGSSPRIGESLVDVWHMVDDGGRLNILDVRKVDRVVVDPAWGKLSYMIPKWDKSWQTPSNVQLAPGTLVFKTLVASLLVTEVQDGPGVTGEHHSLFSIASDEHDLGIIGRIILPNHQPSHQQMDFAVTGRSYGTHNATWATNVDASTTYAGFLLYVIAMHPTDSMGVSERAGLGVVFEKAWYRVNAEAKVVMLR
ncbi:HET-domain-containing protein [Coniophora puteana RWD-64-598 SS2]|uniref:HET-domain-containing protein n=1 Tax=Coniophora puteana (strain RWD-64-598) TaxID=741705 RepID=A0A5M3N7D0_CONPW|nr:HET-domain-containing protein [Coniophora puteana RWD-64-598 SS2]EIW87352.1 HET-domain-containing protein [Coniophora puteana RWD-64-598 SS2]